MNLTKIFTSQTNLSSQYFAYIRRHRGHYAKPVINLCTQ